MWSRVTSYLLERIPLANQEAPNGPLVFPLDDEDWILELTSDGKLLCQSGYALDDMKSLLSDGTAEDLGSDELAKQAKFYLQQTVSKHRPFLQREAFQERMEMNEEYVAMFFEREVDFQDLSKLENLINLYRQRFRPST